MINIVSTPRRLFITILLAGIALFILSLAMPRYNAPGIEQQLNELSVNSDEKGHDNYYKIREEASTNKYLYGDLGSGLIVAAIALLVFISVKNIRTFRDIKCLRGLNKVETMVLSNFAVLLLIPGTIWYYSLRLVRGDYPPFADSIGIPIIYQISTFLFLLIPLNIFLVIASTKSEQPAFIFSKTKTNDLRSVLWELFFGIPLLLAITCALATTIGGDHFFIVVSLFMIYVLLSLRAGKLGIPATDADIEEIRTTTTYDEVIQKVALLLGDLKNKISENTIINHSGYETADELLFALNEYTKRIHHNDEFVFDEIQREFAASGSFRKIAMINNWGKSFVTLARRYEYLHSAVKQKRPTALSSALQQ